MDIKVYIRKEERLEINKTQQSFNLRIQKKEENNPQKVRNLKTKIKTINLA